MEKFDYILTPNCINAIKYDCRDQLNENTHKGTYAKLVFREVLLIRAILRPFYVPIQVLSTPNRLRQAFGYQPTPTQNKLP